MMTLQLVSGDEPPVHHYVFGISRKTMDKLKSGEIITVSGKQIGMTGVGEILFIFRSSNEEILELIKKETGLEPPVSEF